MPPVELVVFATSIGFVAALILTPCVRYFFLRMGICDRPDSQRKLQKDAVSLGGGLAVFLATLIATISTLWWVPANPRGIVGSSLDPRLILLIAATGIVLLGLLDDIMTLRGRQKLLGQVLIVMFLVGAGTVVRNVDILGVKIELGLLALPLTAFWLLGAINAVNLIDGADGIASTAGAIICASLACLATLGDLGFEATVAASMAAALLGFLCFNWPPAKIYLGDSGSMLIGLVVGVFSIWANLKHSATIAFAVPLAALTVPMFDSVVAIVRRVLTGRSIYSADRGHLHHQLSTRFSPKGMLLVVAGLCFLTGMCAVFSVIFRMQWIALVGTACVIVGLVKSGLFGAVESRMVLQRGSVLIKSFFTRARKADDVYLQRSVHLQGSTRWDEIWEALVDFSKKHRLSHLRLDLNLSYRHEGYHGEWRAVRQPERAERWSVFLPVFSRGHAVGKLEIAGRAEGLASLESLETLAAILQDLEPAVERLISELDSTVPKSAAVSPNSDTVAYDETPDLEGSTEVLLRSE